MPIQFSCGTYRSVKQDRQKDVRRLLHIAFDEGYLCDGLEIEAAWEKATFGWAPIPPDDEEVWKILSKCLIST